MDHAASPRSCAKGAWGLAKGLAGHLPDSLATRKNRVDLTATPTGPVPTPPPIPCGSRSPGPGFNAIRAPAALRKSFSTKVRPVSPIPCKRHHPASAAKARLRSIPRDLWHALVSTPPVSYRRCLAPLAHNSAGERKDRGVPRRARYTPTPWREGSISVAGADYFKLLQKFCKLTLTARLLRRRPSARMDLFALAGFAIPYSSFRCSSFQLFAADTICYAFHCKKSPG